MAKRTIRRTGNENLGMRVGYGIAEPLGRVTSHLPYINKWHPWFRRN